MSWAIETKAILSAGPADHQLQLSFFLDEAGEPAAFMHGSSARCVPRLTSKLSLAGSDFICSTVDAVQEPRSRLPGYSVLVDSYCCAVATNPREFQNAAKFSISLSVRGFANSTIVGSLRVVLAR